MAKMSIEIGAKIDAFKRGLVDAKAQVNKFGADVSKKLSNIGIGGALAGAGIAAGIFKALKGSAKLAADFEQTKVAFTTMLGDADKAAGFIDSLTEFSNKTPFTPEQVNKAAKTLLAFGIEAGNVMGTLKILGDVSSGTGKDLSEMAVIFGQVKGAGRLMGGDLLQLINAGFNPLQEMAKRTGKSMSELKDDMGKGLITFDMVEQAFRDASGSGGLFFNMMEKQSETLNGKLSTLEGNIAGLGRSLGEMFLPQIKGVVDGLGQIIDKINEVNEARARVKSGQIQINDPQAESAARGAMLFGPVAGASGANPFAGVSQSTKGESVQSAAPTAAEVAKAAEAAAAAQIEDIIATLERKAKEAESKKVKEFGVNAIADFAEGQMNLFNNGILKIKEEAKVKQEEQDALKSMLEARKGELTDQAGKLQGDISAAFQPGRVIQSSLARIGLEKSIQIDRQIPTQQLNELRKTNELLKNIDSELKNQVPRWPG